MSAYAATQSVRPTLGLLDADAAAAPGGASVAEVEADAARKSRRPRKLLELHQLCEVGLRLIGERLL